MRMSLCVLGLLLPISCAPEAGWPQEAPLQIASPSEPVVTNALATAVEWWMTREPTALSSGPVPVYLTPSLDPARPALQKLLPSCDFVDSDEGNALAIRAVRMHHSSAQIDLDAPRPNRGRQLITLDMRKYTLTPWQVTGANWGRFNDRQLDLITSEAFAASQSAEAHPASETNETTATATPDAEQ